MRDIPPYLKLLTPSHIKVMLVQRAVHGPAHPLTQINFSSLLNLIFTSNSKVIMDATSREGLGVDYTETKWCLVCILIDFSAFMSETTVLSVLYLNNKHHRVFLFALIDVGYILFCTRSV